MNGACEVDDSSGSCGRELKILGGFVAVFLALFFLPVEFIDVWKYPEAGKQYGIEMIPTQIFFDAGGKERFRHVGFFGKEDILGKWKTLGVELSGKAEDGIVREEPVKAETRSRDPVCFMCDEDIQSTTRTVVKGHSDQRVLCSPHCYFIYLSSIVGADAKAEETKVSVTDWASGNLVAATAATHLYGMDARGRPTIKAFADKAAAVKEQQTSPGNPLAWDVPRSKEFATRCAFCDRAVYPENACGVKFGTTHGHGCCTHCSMGVAARLRQDIEVEAKDGLTGEPRRGLFSRQWKGPRPVLRVCAWFRAREPDVVFRRSPHCWRGCGSTLG